MVAAKAGDYFSILVRAIISQMLSVKAATTIFERLKSTIKPKKITPENILAMKQAELRAIGLSNGKALALLDLAARTKDGRLPLKKFHTLEDIKIIELLTDVKGIGKWTAEMFLIFALVRMDVWPIDDLGVRAAIMKIDGLAAHPDKNQMLPRGDSWKPYRSIASWYLWQSLKNTPK